MQYYYYRTTIPYHTKVLPHYHTVLRYYRTYNCRTIPYLVNTRHHQGRYFIEICDVYIGTHVYQQLGDLSYHNTSPSFRYHHQTSPSFRHRHHRTSPSFRYHHHLDIIYTSSSSISERQRDKKERQKRETKSR